MSYEEVTKEMSVEIEKLEKRLVIEKEVLRRVESIIFLEETKKQREIIEETKKQKDKIIDLIKTKRAYSPTLGDRILQCMTNNSERRFTIKDVRRHIESICPGKYKKNSMYTALFSLLQNGEIIKLSRGLYKVVITENVFQEQNGVLIPTVLRT